MKHNLLGEGNNANTAIIQCHVTCDVRVCVHVRIAEIRYWFENDFYVRASLSISGVSMTAKEADIL